MEEKKLKAMFFNGSPRRNKNTADMLQSAMRGAEAAIPRLSTFITLINSVTIHATTLMLSQKRTSGNIVTSTMTST